MVSEQVRDSRFVLVFAGECPFVGVFNGWDALMAEIRTQYTPDDDEHAELVERLEDEDGWTCDGRAPFCYCENTGEIGSMSIYRITQPGKRLFARVPNSDGQLWHCGGPDLEEAIRGLRNILESGGEEGESLPIDLEIREMTEAEVSAIPDV